MKLIMTILQIKICVKPYLKLLESPIDKILTESRKLHTKGEKKMEQAKAET